jgi:hypothetical protein
MTPYIYLRLEQPFEERLIHSARNTFSHNATYSKNYKVPTFREDGRFYQRQEEYTEKTVSPFYHNTVLRPAETVDSTYHIKRIDQTADMLFFLLLAVGCLMHLKALIYKAGRVNIERR